jgi:hypothetical protein
MAKNRKKNPGVETFYAEMADMGVPALENPRGKGRKGGGVNRGVESSYSALADEIAEATGQFK